MLRARAGEAINGYRQSLRCPGNNFRKNLKCVPFGNTFSDMNATLTRSERLVARVTSEDKQLFERAAALQHSTVARFIVSNLRNVARKLIHEHEVVQLNPEETRRFVKALLSPPRPPASRARRALALYRESVTEH